MITMNYIAKHRRISELDGSAGREFLGGFKGFLANVAGNSNDTFRSFFHPFKVALEMPQKLETCVGSILTFGSESQQAPQEFGRQKQTTSVFEIITLDIFELVEGKIYRKTISLG